MPVPDFVEQFSACAANQAAALRPVQSLTGIDKPFLEVKAQIADLRQVKRSAGVQQAGKSLFGRIRALQFGIRAPGSTRHGMNLARDRPLAHTMFSCNEDGAV